jgi:hypothetical protein
VTLDALPPPAIFYSITTAKQYVIEPSDTVEVESGWIWIIAFLIPPNLKERNRLLTYSHRLTVLMRLRLPMDDYD